MPRDVTDLHSVAISSGSHEYERHRARRTVVRRATSVSEARELLEMLDLIPREGEMR